MNEKHSIEKVSESVSPSATESKPRRKRRPPAVPWKKPKDMPKRPLSAYNLFFKAERERMLSDTMGEVRKSDIGSENEAPSPGRPHLHKGPSNSRSGSRKHARSSGIGFANLARIISGKWKTLDADIKAPFEEEASIEKERYKQEMVEWRAQQQLKESSREREEHDAASFRPPFPGSEHATSEDWRKGKWPMPSPPISDLSGDPLAAHRFYPAYRPRIQWNSSMHSNPSSTPFIESADNYQNNEYLGHWNHHHSPWGYHSGRNGSLNPDPAAFYAMHRYHDSQGFSGDSQNFSQAFPEGDSASLEGRGRPIPGMRSHVPATWNYSRGDQYSNNPRTPYNRVEHNSYPHSPAVYVSPETYYSGEGSSGHTPQFTTHNSSYYVPQESPRQGDVSTVQQETLSHRKSPSTMSDKNTSNNSETKPPGFASQMKRSRLSLKKAAHTPKSSGIEHKTEVTTLLQSPIDTKLDNDTVDYLTTMQFE